jgi:hypothetical protein
MAQAFLFGVSRSQGQVGLPSWRLWEPVCFQGRSVVQIQLLAVWAQCPHVFAGCQPGLLLGTKLAQASS